MITTILVVAPWSALAIWSASHTRALTTTTTSIASESSAGHRYVLTCSCSCSYRRRGDLCAGRHRHGSHPTRTESRAYAAMLGIRRARSALPSYFARFGSPIQMRRPRLPRIRRAVRDIHGRPQSTACSTWPAANGFRNGRSPGATTRPTRCSARAPERMPATGTSCDRLRRRSSTSTTSISRRLRSSARSDSSPWSVALGAPLVAAVRARRHALVAAAAAAYAAFLIHAAVDWDWQMPAVTLVALFCAGAIVVAVKDDRADRLRIASRWRVGRRHCRCRPWARRVRRAARQPGTLREPQRGGGQQLVGLGSGRAQRSRLGTVVVSAAAARSVKRRPRRGISPPRAGASPQALAIDDTDWSVWFDLALASSGPARAHALSQALRLNPLSPEIASWRAETAPAATR